MIRILFLILPLLLCGCSSSRKVKENVTQKIDKVLVCDSMSMAVDTYGNGHRVMQWDSAWHNAILKFRIYDTSRPDSLGNCPMMAEGELEVDGGKISLENSSDTTALANMLVTEKHEDAHEVEEVKKKNSITTKRVVEGYQWWVLGILAFLNGALIWYLRKQK